MTLFFAVNELLAFFPIASKVYFIKMQHEDCLMCSVILNKGKAYVQRGLSPLVGSAVFLKAIT